MNDVSRRSKRSKKTNAAGNRATWITVNPSPDGCEDCLKMGGRWLHLRMCESCGHVGYFDQSPNGHATKHYQTTKHPIISSRQPGEDWG